MPSACTKPTSISMWAAGPAGALFVASVGAGFHVGYVTPGWTGQQVVMDGRSIATYYLMQGAFWTDAVPCVATLMQVWWLDPDRSADRSSNTPGPEHTGNIVREGGCTTMRL